MHIKSSWSYLNKELLAILSFLVVSTLASLVYLGYTLIGVHAFTTQGSNAVATAFVLQDLLINVQDAETAAQGYVITGDAAALSTYTKARGRVPIDLSTVKNDKDIQLTSGQIQRVTKLTEKQLASMEQAVHAQDSEGFTAAQAVFQNEQTAENMNELRSQVSTISSIKLRNIGPMRKRADDNLQRALVVSGAMAVFVLGTCAAVIWYFKRAILHERALESTKNEFLSLASHQLRTPATNVKQYLGLLIDGYMGDLNDEQRHALSVAYKNNESEISIMNTLLDVAKLDLERIQIHKKVTNVMIIARHVVREHHSMAKERGQTIKLNGPKQAMASVDEVYIKGVIENLVDNAVKYSKEGTSITVEVERHQDSVCVAVSDHGLGIKKRDYGKLFNKFSRLDNEFSANSQGSGLGLYWVNQIVKLHNGTIDVSSKEGKGSVFTVKLPIR
jgi:signal transduction histidine kinase